MVLFFVQSDNVTKNCNDKGLVYDCVESGNQQVNYGMIDELVIVDATRAQQQEWNDVASC